MGGKRGKEHQQVGQHLAAVAFHCTQFVDTYHERAHRCVIREMLYIAGYFLYKLMNRLQRFSRRFVIIDQKSVTLIEKIPKFLDKTVHTVDTVGIPWFALFYRPQEHFIQTQRIGTVTFNDVVGVHHVEHGFRHLLNSPSANIFPVLEDEFRISIFRTPFTESIDVELVVVDNVHIHMDRGDIIILLQVEGNKRIGILYAVNEIAPPLNHPLVYKLFERLVFTDFSKVIEELVPKT